MVSQAHSYRYFEDKSPSDVGVLNSREFRSERKVNPSLSIIYGVDKLLKERHLWSTPTNVFPYNQNVVREFYANLSASCGDPESSRYGMVYVRGQVYSFTPELINELFGLPTVVVSYMSLEGASGNVVVSELTGGKIKKWDARFASTKLTWKYVVLHKLAISNWMFNKNTTILTKDQTVLIYKICFPSIWVKLFLMLL